MTETRQDNPPDNKRDLLKGATANLAGFVVRLGARLPFLFVVALLYGMDIFGRYLLAVTIVETCTAFILFGFNRSLFHFLPYDNKGDVFHNVCAAVIICTAIGMAVIAPIFLWQDLLFQLFPHEMARAVIILLPTAVLYALAEILLTATRAARIMRYEVTAKSIIEPYILTIFSAGLYFTGFAEEGLFIAYWVMNISILIYAIFSFGRVYERKNRVWHGLSWHHIKAMVRFSAPTAAYDLVNVLTLRMDIYILAAMVSPVSLGIYGIILQIITVVKKIRQSFDPILQPVISQILKSASLPMAALELSRVSGWIFSLQALIFTLLIFYAPALLGMFNITDDMASVTLLILIAAIIIQSSFGLNELIFLYMKPTINPLLSLIILPLHVAICYSLIGGFGILGAALSLLISYTLTEIIRLVLIKYFFGIFPVRAAIFKAIFPSAILFGYLSMMTQYMALYSISGLFIEITSGIVIYSLTFFIISAKEDRAIFLKRLGFEKAAL